MGQNKGRLPQNCIHTACLSLRFLDAILRNDGVYIAGIKNNTRGFICCDEQRLLGGAAGVA